MLRGDGRRDVAEYVGTLSRDLSDLSRRSGLPTLAYLLDMARLEAETIARRKDDAPDDAAEPPAA